MKLVVLREGGSRMEVQLSKFLTSIGRDANSDVKICHPSVSRRHCIIRTTEHNVYMEVLSSSGALVNGALVRQGQTVDMRQGDKIAFRSNAIQLPTIVVDKTRIIRQQTLVADLDSELRRVIEAETEEPAQRRSRSRSVIRQQQQSSSSSSSPEVTSTLDAIVDAVTCSICMELVHNAVSPCQCLHAFCGGCLSAWVFRRGTPRVNCPKCRTSMRSVSANHVAASISAELEKVRPDDAKTPEDKTVSDQANRFAGKKVFHLADMFLAEYGSHSRNWRRRRLRNNHPSPTQ
ncbi:unnamed protein product [Notodromas monacha]|uniref:E3 ubiquitin-protein ligase CHFR n=1 Tax=Notodromas monacha TaxID=399045 RepID=A0A7R9GAY8_9CRUS|nr:unnamed protein product [Notodromas monacha]CAG0915765.1 unnamed protein product [Notodromas monacha]